jgi:hypothetical protein
VPWYQADEVTEAARAWALSEVSVIQRRASGVPQPDRERAELIKAAKSEWSMWEQDHPLLVLEPDGDHWCGVVTKEGEGQNKVIYDRPSGLRLLST